MRERERERERARENATVSAMVRRGKIARRRVAEGRSAASQWSTRCSRLLWMIEKENPKSSSGEEGRGFVMGSLGTGKPRVFLRRAKSLYQG